MRNSMMNFSSTAVLLSMAIFVVLGAVPGYAAEKITLCHFPPGDPENAHSIAVGESAVGAHLDHGDALGGCDELGSCGDGVVEESEGCDPPDFAGRTCEDVYGPGAVGTPGCTELCELTPGSCQGCGDGVVQPELLEECDPPDPGCDVGDPGCCGPRCFYFQPND